MVCFVCHWFQLIFCHAGGCRSLSTRISIQLKLLFSSQTKESVWLFSLQALCRHLPLVLLCMWVMKLSIDSVDPPTFHFLQITRGPSMDWFTFSDFYPHSKARNVTCFSGIGCQTCWARSCLKKIAARLALISSIHNLSLLPQVALLCSAR